MTLDNEKIDEAVLALLFLGLHDGSRAWKSFDWEAMHRLHEKGLISDPRGKAQSVMFTEQGSIKAQQLLEKLFAQNHESREQPSSGNEDVPHLRLSAQRALLTHVTPPLRSVSVDVDPCAKMVFVRFIFEREPSASERDAAACAGTEIIADYVAPWNIEEECLVCPAPGKMEHRKWLVYHRCEDAWVSPTA